MNTTVYNNSNKIQDFGQKIGGARKDYFAELKEFGESLCKVDIETLKNNPLSSTKDYSPPTIIFFLLLKKR